MPSDNTTLVILIAALWTLIAFALVMAALGCVTYALVLMVRHERATARAPRTVRADAPVQPAPADVHVPPADIAQAPAPAAAQDVHPALAFQAGRFGGGLRAVSTPKPNGKDPAALTEEVWMDAPND